MKKRRTKAQIAATKKLVAFNKKRRGKKVTKKKGRKKRRSAKQLAATRKLVALNKRRGEKKVTRRKNPQRKKVASKGTSVFLVFRCKGKSVYFLGLKSGTKFNLSSWKQHKEQAVLFGTKKGAALTARIIANKRGLSGWDIGVAPSDMTKAQIAAQCGGKA